MTRDEYEDLYSYDHPDATPPRCELCDRYDDNAGRYGYCDDCGREMVPCRGCGFLARRSDFGADQLCLECVPEEIGTANEIEPSAARWGY